MAAPCVMGPIQLNARGDVPLVEVGKACRFGAGGSEFCPCGECEVPCGPAVFSPVTSLKCFLDLLQG